jgi:hypothetical protein
MREYTRVRLLSNKYIQEGARQGMLGYVIEVYKDGNYEVEFSDPDTGLSLAQIVVAPEDVVESPESSA